MADEVVFKKRMAEGFKGQQSCILPEQNRRFCATHTLCRKLYITDIGFYPHAALHSRERPGGAEQYILIYCVKGAGWYRIEGKIFPVKEHHYFIIPPGKAHEYGADEQDPWSIYWVHFMGEQAAAICKFLWSSRQAGPQIAAPSPLRNMLFDDILHHLELMNNEENIIYANSCVYAFLVSFKQAQLRPHDRKNHPVEEVITYMKNNLDKNLTLEQLSQAVKMSPSHLSALFRQQTKYSPVNLFVSLKMQKAGQLLLESDHSVKYVGHVLGYDDPYHFSRVFKKTMGMSPRQFKGNTN